METKNCASLKMSMKWLVFSQKNDQNQTNEAENLNRPLSIKVINKCPPILSPGIVTAECYQFLNELIRSKETIPTI